MQKTTRTARDRRLGAPVLDITVGDIAIIDILPPYQALSDKSLTRNDSTQIILVGDMIDWRRFLDHAILIVQSACFLNKQIAADVANLNVFTRTVLVFGYKRPFQDMVFCRSGLV